MTPLTLGIVGLFWVVNMLASWWNARSAGNVWKTSKIFGGWQRFMVWATVFMSAAGFTWCYTTVIGIVAYELHKLNEQSVELLFNMAYIVVGPTVVLAGIAFSFDSWKRRVQTGTGTGLALWNTGATVYNTINLARFFDKAIKSVIDSMRRNPQFLIVFGVFIAAAFGGILTTYGLVKHYAKNDRLAPVERTPRTQVQDAGYGDYGYRRRDW